MQKPQEPEEPEGGWASAHDYWMACRSAGIKVDSRKYMQILDVHDMVPARSGQYGDVRRSQIHCMFNHIGYEGNRYGHF